MNTPERKRNATRYPLDVSRNCDLCVISFRNLAWADHTVQIKDISTEGIGITLSGTVEPGFVWFHDRLTGCRSGVLLWSRQEGPRFRAGIQLAPLTRDEEAYVHEQVAIMRKTRSLPDPQAVIDTILRSLSRFREN
ncbi:MAG: hypothetical protein M0042_06485 [Nitrospiraceae bacterium]|nr:hypothetical protein [Nitrospiraceae bacterium]